MNNYSMQNGYYNPYTYMNSPMPPMMPPYAAGPNPTQPLQAPAVLNGKFIDSADILKVTEIPMGGYGVFPKADFSEVYLKYWTNDGKTDIMKFVPDKIEVKPSEQELAIQLILEKVNNLEEKLNSYLSSNSLTPVVLPQILKKEVQINDY